MKYTEEDVDFGKLSSNFFEELCFDLISRNGFYELIWRDGGADSGRDIEAKYQVKNELVEAFSEKWFFECKNWKKGVPVHEVSSKIDWATSEDAEHLVFIVASYLTNDCRTYVEKRKQQVPVRIHIIEGKRLRKLVLSFPDIVERYFSNQAEKILRNAHLDWLFMNILPGASQLQVILEEILVDRMSIEEMAFIIISIGSSESGRALIDNLSMPNSESALEKFLSICKYLSTKSDLKHLSDLDRFPYDRAKSGTIYTTHLKSERVSFSICSRPISLKQFNKKQIGIETWIKISKEEWTSVILVKDSSRKQSTALVKQKTPENFSVIFPEIFDFLEERDVIDMFSETRSMNYEFKER